MKFSSSLLLVSLAAPHWAAAHRTGCDADNCLRALSNPTRTAAASSFCHSYTQSVVTATDCLPPQFATACGSGPTQASRLSSACSRYVSAAPPSCGDTSSSNNNCGTCDNACPAGSSCLSGACVCTNSGKAPCNGACPDLTSDNDNCGTCGQSCASGTTCQSGTCVAPPANCTSTTYTASCSDVINGVLASNSIASPELVDYRIQSAILGITSPADFLAALGANPCDGLFTDPSERATCVDLLAKSDFVAELTDIVKGVLASLQTCAADFADGGSTDPITITEPTCPAQRTVRRNVHKRDEDEDLTATILAEIEHYQSTAPAPALGPKKASASSRSLDLVALSRRQASTCANTGQCFERCPDCRAQQTYCGSTATIITTAVCGAVGVAANAVVATVSAAACGTACAPLGPGAAVCANICGRAAGGAAALAVGTTCAVARAAICDPLTQRCANCNSFNNGICDPSSTQCCPGETGTQCGQGCCCCPSCQAPGGINCACTAAPC